MPPGTRAKGAAEQDVWACGLEILEWAENV